ncbi:hypothetical protein B0A48_10817 [Cryoendolithus antarcticus]|uniref:Uncharacterized protein n=1 Tax=Cryoendolithus antarcticus TaxID=1507870 RepID=A0A1V8SYH3_9PEZI|nr:hypothetical protein B0A48_10817 [Cryoendolithus antarcticus]
MPLHRSSLLPNIAALISLLPVALGIAALYSPRTALSNLSFPLPASHESQALADALVRFYSGRNIAIGLTNLLAWYGGHRTVLGSSMIIGTVVAGVDGWASRILLGAGTVEWGHWMFTFLGLALGGGILEWW